MWIILKQEHYNKEMVGYADKMKTQRNSTAYEYKVT
jgi:hypothetical protein